VIQWRETFEVDFLSLFLCSVPLSILIPFQVGVRNSLAPAFMHWSLGTDSSPKWTSDDLAFYPFFFYGLPLRFHQSGSIAFHFLMQSSALLRPKKNLPFILPLFLSTVGNFLSNRSFLSPPLFQSFICDQLELLLLSLPPTSL